MTRLSMRLFTVLFILGYSANASASGSIQGNSGAGMGQALMGAGMNGITAGLMFTQAEAAYAEKNYGQAALYTAAGVLSLAQMGMDLAGAKGYGKTKDAATAGGGSGYAGDFGAGSLPPPDPMDDLVKNLENDYAGYKGQLDNLRVQGFNYDPNKNVVTTPDGQTVEVDPSDLKDLKSLAAKTGDSGTASKILAAQEAIKNALADQIKAAGGEANVVAMGVEGGSGGYDYNGGSGEDGEKGPDPLAALLKKYQMGGRDPAGAVAGLSKTYGGERIGVKSDNLFEMVHRKYQELRKKNEFIETQIK